MSWWRDILDAVINPGGIIVGSAELIIGQQINNPLAGPGTGLPPTVPPSDTETDAGSAEAEAAAKRFLLVEAAILGGVVAAPALYRAATARRKGKKATRDTLMLEELNHSSARATALLAALGPTVIFPAAYITIQKMEGAKIISSGLGNAVQGLMTTMAVAPLAGTVIGAVGKAI